ncbi:MAG TPA: putative ABC exporter domain-containing protein [Gemmatimonadaceae bacterium]|nr:putative ABC exporter domain-containing protein [Gemmatimonadaceae bacterium]
MNAFLYLTWTSARNRIWFQLRRVRSPRYAAALIVGAIYIWSFLLRPTPRGPGSSIFLGQATEMLVTLLAVITLMGTWVFGSDTTALAFTQAELSLLFPGPLSRRQLIGYKLYRAQIAVLFNAVIWVFVLRRGGTALPSPLRAIGIWALFSTLNLHRLGAAILRSSWREHGGAAMRRTRWSVLVFIAIGASIAGGVFMHRAELFAAPSIGVFFDALGRTLATPPAIIGLYPFHLVVAPTFAHTLAEWSREIPLALLVLAAHAWWVLRTDAAFEDAAIEASAERAKRLDAMRARRSVAAVGAPRPATSSLRLAEHGHPAIAIIWKNTLCLRRTAQLRLFIGPLVMAIAVGAATSGAGADFPAFLSTTALVLAAMMLIFGGRLIRNDLRHDMLNLPLLKSLPIAPGDIVLAEVASAALPMSAVQMVLILIAYAAMLASAVQPFSPSIHVALLCVAPFAVIALNLALLTIQNATAVLFPAWIRLGPAVNTGVEALGQNVLATLANLISLGVALVVPLLISWGTVVWMHQQRPVAIALVIVLSAVVLVAETYGAMRLLGTALARAEPAQSG